MRIPELQEEFISIWTMWHYTHAESILESTCLQIKDILQSECSDEKKNILEMINILEWIILSRWYMLDTFMHPLKDIWKESESKLLFPPLIALIKTQDKKSSPLLISESYTVWLWAESLWEVIKHIENNTALSTYYTEKSLPIWLSLTKELSENWWYRWKELRTKKLRTISWDSNWYIEDTLAIPLNYQVRVWSDVTWWEHSNDLHINNSLSSNSWIHLDTLNVIDKFISAVRTIIIWQKYQDPTLQDLLNRLRFFRILARIVDHIWNETNFIINMKYRSNEMLSHPSEWNNWILPKWIIFNWAYTQATWYTKQEIINFINEWKLNKVLYWESSGLVTDIVNEWEGQNWYVMDFPLKRKDNSIHSIPWVRQKNVQSWVAITTMWIGTNHKPYSDDEMTFHELDDDVSF